MPFLRLPDDVRSRFADLPELAMGTHYVVARVGRFGSEAAFLVLGSTFAIPIEPYASWTSVNDISGTSDLDAEPAREPSDAFEVVHDFRSDIARALRESEAQLRAAIGAGIAPPPVVPPPGASLPLKTKTSGEDAFLRFSYTSHDPRTTSGTVAKGTYATTYLDGSSITSGFSAVARYALPVPLAAKHLTLLTPPARTDVHLGASGPLFGQSGGGVEAYFPNAFKNMRRPFTVPEY